jgi:cell wall-associated NlpC family hydrolase
LRNIFNISIDKKYYNCFMFKEDHMDNRRKRQLRHIGYSFMAVGLAASMTVSSSAMALAATTDVEPALSEADDSDMSEQAVNASLETAAPAETYAVMKTMAEVAETVFSTTTAQTSEAAKDIIPAKPDMTKPSDSVPIIAKKTEAAETGKSEETEPSTSGQAATAPITSPAADDHTETQPGTSEPGTSAPGATEPGATEPGISEPGTTEPGTSDPAATEPGTSEPVTTEPGTSEPGTSEPGTSEPGTSDPAATEPGTSEPGTTEPGTSDPAATEPGTTDPAATTAPATTTTPSTGGIDYDLVIPSLPSNFNVSPEQYSAIRAAIVKQARALEGKVSYFWGGKSTSIGWDSRWGVPQVVTIAGSKSTGTTRSYGLDCSGYVAWVFANAYGTAGIISKVGFNTPEQWANSFPIEWQQVQIGDLLFKTTPYAGVTNHIGIVVDIGDDGTIWVAHCSSSRNGVVVTPAHSSGFRYIRRSNLFNGDTAAPAIVNMADLKIPEGVEVSGAEAAAAVNTVATRDWSDVGALAADLAAIFPDPVFAAAVAEGIWNVYAQIPDEAAAKLIADASETLGVLKASEIAEQFASSDASLRQLHLDDYGFKDLLDMVQKAEITVRSVGPAVHSQLTYSEIKENASSMEELTPVMLQDTAAQAAAPAEAIAAEEAVNETEAATADARSESLAGIIVDFMADFTADDAGDDNTEAMDETEAAPEMTEAGAAQAEADQTEAVQTEAVQTEAPQTEAAAADAAAAAEATETKAAQEADKPYVPIESIEGIQYLRSARKIDLTNNNIRDLLPLDYYRANTSGAYIYNVSVYYQNEEGLWFEDEEGNTHEDGALKLYFGGGVPGTSEEYQTELYVSGNPVETVPEEFPGRLWLDFIEQTKAQEMALTVAAERFASDGGVKEDFLLKTDNENPVVLDIDYMPAVALPSEEDAKQESGEGRVARTEG